MSLNWVMLDARREPVPLPQERIISTVLNADLTINFSTPPRTLRAIGTIWLTTERVSRPPRRGQTLALIRVNPQFVFVASPQTVSPSLFALVSQALPAAIKPEDNADRSIKVDSLSLPWLSVLSTSFVQPYFAANYLSMDVKPAPDGGLELGTRVEARLTDQGMFEFIKRVENVRAKAIERAREARLGDPLRECLDPFITYLLTVCQLYTTSHQQPRPPNQQTTFPLVTQSNTHFHSLHKRVSISPAHN
ncbi:hypothetical protein FRC10_002135 [Ceratobasidium sp. 414]|nr:hypothetical protein FRC10_002135 [Ceratobasidium sp. 414]